MKRTGSGERKATRQCWECLKRRLVCDRTLPHCKKCTKTRNSCPGYDEQRPLQWIEPGKVTSRRSRKDNPPKVYTIQSKSKEATAPAANNSTAVSFEDSDKTDLPVTIAEDIVVTLEQPITDEPDAMQEAVDLYKCQLVFALLKEENAVWWDGLSDDEQTEHIMLMATRYASGSAVATRIAKIGGRKNLKSIVERGQHWEAAKILQSEQEPLEKMRHLLRNMEMQNLPSYEYLSNETCEVVQAVAYCEYVHISDKASTYTVRQQ